MPLVNVREDALLDLKKAVIERHGKLRGVLGEEASTAVRERAQAIRDESTQGNSEVR